MDFTKLFQQQALFFILIACGYILRKRNVLNEAGQRVLTDLAFTLFIPASIIKAFNTSFDMRQARPLLLVFLISCLVQLSVPLINQLFYRRYRGDDRSILYFATLCSNANLIGIPTAMSVYGEIGLLYTSIYLVPLRSVIWSSGVAIFSRRDAQGKPGQLWKNVLFHPCTLAVILGLILMLSPFVLPPVITLPLNSLAACNTPIVMLIIGGILAQMPLRRLFNGTALYFCLIRLLIMPLLVYLGCRLFALDALITGICVLLTAMPAGSLTAIFATRYNFNQEFATRIVVLSTLLSVVTIPLWSYFLTQ